MTWAECEAIFAAAMLKQRSAMAIEIKEMWSGGPLREWSAMNPARWVSHGEKGYVGSYVCQHCRKPCVGVYKVDAQMWPSKPAGNWICGRCKEELRPKQAQPEGLRRHAETA